MPERDIRFTQGQEIDPRYNRPLLAVGTQIIWVPEYARLAGMPEDERDEKHPHAQEGYVERDEGKYVLCRFFRRGVAHDDPMPLRTLDRGEFCKPHDLLVRDHRDQAQIVRAQELVRMYWGIDEGGMRP